MASLKPSWQESYQARDEAFRQWCKERIVETRVSHGSSFGQGCIPGILEINWNNGWFLGIEGIKDLETKVPEGYSRPQMVGITPPETYRAYYEGAKGGDAWRSQRLVNNEHSPT